MIGKPLHDSVETGSLDAGWFRQRYARTRFTSSGYPCRFQLSTQPDGKAPCGRSHGACDRSARRCSRWCCLRPISASARSRTIRFQPGMGVGEHGVCLGGTGADHPDLDAGFRRDGGAGGDRRYRQRDQAVSDGGVGIADAANAATKRRHLILAAHFIAVTLWVECFRLLPQVPRERRIAFIHGLGIGLRHGLPGRHHDRLRPCGQSAATVRAPRSCC